MTFYEVASSTCQTLVHGTIVANVNRRLFSRVHAAALGCEWDLLERLGAGRGTFRSPCHPMHFESSFLETERNPRKPMTWRGISSRPYLKEDEPPTFNTSRSSSAYAAALITNAKDAVVVPVPAVLTAAEAAEIVSEGLARILGEAPASDELLVAAGIDSLSAVQVGPGRCCPPCRRYAF